MWGCLCADLRQVETLLLNLGNAAADQMGLLGSVPKNSVVQIKAAQDCCRLPGMGLGSSTRPGLTHLPLRMSNACPRPPQNPSSPTSDTCIGQPQPMHLYLLHGLVVMQEGWCMSTLLVLEWCKSDIRHFYDTSGLASGI